jgi:hypothetical protein
LRHPSLNLRGIQSPPQKAPVRGRARSTIGFFFPVLKNGIGLVTDRRPAANMSFLHRWKSP